MTYVDQTTPLISVLVPIYNVERYLEECLDSLRAQTFDSFEVLCINDGSTDGSAAIVQRYIDIDTRFKLINKPNSGYGASMNQGLDAARGAYIAILESDDLFMPQALEVLYQTLRAHNAQVAKANFTLYWSEPQKRTQSFDVVGTLANRTLCPSVEGHEFFYQKPSIWSALYSRTFLAENNIRFLETPGASYQDASFSFKAFAAAECVSFIADEILLYRQDNEASSVNSAGKVFCVCDEYAEMQRWLAKHPELESRLKKVLAHMKLNTYLWNYNRLSPNLREKFFPTMRAELQADFDEHNFDENNLGLVRTAELNALLFNPQRFSFAWRNGEPQPGKWNLLKHVYALGGLQLLIFLAGKKLKG
ncbi:glycosyltransferase family 2 protein [Atopobium fossor]|uniref:glycosyltransferase family 2 protein n=1 Tax=Atopobium fossor TaxID=39487 RepID=UPI0003F9236E|nr:glycosyltransferase family 2 protein [Atopobium fossor]